MALYFVYNCLWIILTNDQKADQAKSNKTEPNFNNILEQTLELDTQKKVSKFW